MDTMDFNPAPTPPPAPRRQQSGAIWNILTVLVLFVVGCVAIFSLAIFTNPYTAFNPFPPPTLAPTIVIPTSTPTPVVILPPTWTPTVTLPATETFTPTPTETLPPTPTPITLTPTTQPSPTVPQGGYPYVVREGSPKAIPNIYHPELGCNWMGVGGQVIDMSGAPVTGLIMKLGGSLPGVTLASNTLSLTGVAINYGRAGYEFTLADHPVASRQSLWIQVLDQQGTPLSEKVFFNTFDSCEQNLILLDFKQVR